MVTNVTHPGRSRHFQCQSTRRKNYFQNQITVKCQAGQLKFQHINTESSFRTCCGHIPLLWAFSQIFLCLCAFFPVFSLALIIIIIIKSREDASLVPVTAYKYLIKLALKTVTVHIKPLLIHLPISMTKQYRKV